MTEKVFYNSTERKVFCKNCSFLLLEGNFLSYVCVHPRNVSYKLIKQDWYSEEYKTTYERKPCIINANNDCEWFTRRVYG